MLGIAAMAVYSLGVITQVLQFLQPVLVPVAFAAILAYLLEPLVKKLVERGTPHFRAMMWVWIGFHSLMLLLLLSVAVPTISQGSRWISVNHSNWRQSVNNFVTYTVSSIDKLMGHEELPTPEQAVKATQKEHLETMGLHEEDNVSPSAGGVTVAPPAGASAKASSTIRNSQVSKWVAEHTDEISARIMKWLGTGVQGFVGMFGYFVGFILVPLYLYYFLKESASIKKNWHDYLPLRKSTFKEELVDCLTEINGYLIAFFRGQMLVSMIDGFLVGASLALILRLPYSLLIGVFVALLGLIPYVGNIICWLAATAISVAHFGQTNASGVLINTWPSLPQVWVYPLIVTAIFVFVQKINSLVTAPRIVGDAVGLHPLTVIFSVLFWSLLIGGLLGALLAVPLTASLKVILRRYVWEKRVAPRLEASSFTVT